MRFVPGEVDDAMFDSPEQLVHDLRLVGYYGGIRMLKAVAKLFFDGDLAKIRKQITAMRLTPGIEHSSSVPIQFSTEILAVFFARAMVSAPFKGVGGPWERSRLCTVFLHYYT